MIMEMTSLEEDMMLEDETVKINKQMAIEVEDGKEKTFAKS